MSHNLRWNLWIWEGRSWRVLAAYENEGDARDTMERTFGADEPMTISRVGTPKDEHMRDNVTVRYAPENYIRLQVDNDKDKYKQEWYVNQEKTADHTARGGFDT